MQQMLGDISEIILGHSFRGAIAEVPEGNYAVLQAKNVQSKGIVDDEALVQVDLTGTKVNALVQHKDVLLSNRGTFRAAVFYGHNPDVLAASSLYIIRTRDIEKCLPEFLAIFLNSQKGQTLLQEINRGTLIKSLPKKSLMTFPVPLPSVAVQNTVMDIYNNYAARVDLYQRKALLEEQIANQAIASLISQ